MFANPTAAYVVESTGDKEQLSDALTSAIDDVLRNAIAFPSTVVTLRGARIVGDRIYILLLIADDDDGEETIKNLSTEDGRSSLME
jgi:hypothetical protein